MALPSGKLPRRLRHPRRRFAYLGGEGWPARSSLPLTFAAPIRRRTDAKSMGSRPELQEPGSVNMSQQLRDGITEYITNKFYGRPLLRDAWRETYAEALVYAALQDNAPQSGWRPAAATQPWDLENDDRIQLQVKQTAALQPGSNGKNRGRPQSLSFDIHPGETGRQTHIYIFAWHPESDPDIADHHDVNQWRFCVLPEDELPEPALEQKTQRISLPRIKSLAADVGLKPVAYNELGATITRIAAVILEADLEDARLIEEDLERIRSGEERVYSSAEVRAYLGLDC